MTDTELDEVIYKKIREKMPGCHQFLNVFSSWNSVKLDGTYSMDDLKHIVRTFEQYKTYEK